MKRALIAGLALSLLGTTIPSANATFPGRNGRIVVHSSPLTGGDWVYRSIPRDGSRAALFPFGGDAARLSPDDRWVVFGQDGNLWRQYLPEEDPLQLTTDGQSGYASWSPDSQHLVFSRQETSPGLGPRISLFSMNSDGSSQTPLTSEAFDFLPVWSPDATRVAFVRCLSYRFSVPSVVVFGQRFDPVSGCEDPSDIFIWDMEGQITQLTSSPESESDPDWSPDSRKLAFSCDVDREAETGKGGVCILNLRTERVRVIYRSRNRGFDPSWSPNGKRLAFVVVPRNEEDTDSEIYTIRTDGSSLRRVTRNHREDMEPQWLAR